MSLQIEVVGVRLMKLKGIQMKKLTLLFTLLFSMMFSSTSFAEWTKMDTNVKGDTVYLDADRLRKVAEGGRYAYYWTLIDLLEPNNVGSLSVEAKQQVDCDLRRMKRVTYNYYKDQMGRGSADQVTPSEQEWIYPKPNSFGEKITNILCN